MPDEEEDFSVALLGVPSCFSPSFGSSLISSSYSLSSLVFFLSGDESDRFSLVFSRLAFISVSKYSGSIEVEDSSVCLLNRRLALLLSFEVWTVFITW